MHGDDTVFFIASKVLGFFLVPSNLIALLCAIGALLTLTRARRRGVKLLTVGVALLLVAGYTPLGNALLLPLSERFPPWQDNGRAPDGIIVLGGAINSDLSAARGVLELEASAERIVTVLELARRYPQARIVLSGGSANLLAPGNAEAPFAGRLLQAFGVAPERIALESGSRTTTENAVQTKRLVAPKAGERWLLVTSAFHMPRSIGAFRAAGFEVEAYPVDWRTRGWNDLWWPFERLSMGLARTDLAVHEWVGLIAYRWARRSTELVPGPR
ncbi:uncharacterized SAM-binding protein YcdF (DUF218 family) [Rhodopseudomonas faecalis]|uniref:Uncharacterized SAM-binding protein YcdF (DUF218 family) n=1 Tax=Rhodopseudomonas faecalis TaxID=99655 RepID=A0A318TF93_9BRAD|nr:uncharacterized SAM-binding protein YcdF (DUF218 family) [Rhodopseudomonas faecalis]